MAVPVLLAGLALVPTPYYILAPGSAVDIGRHVVVEGRVAPSRRYFLTDVNVARASLLLLAGGFLPGRRIVKREFLIPPGETARGSERIQVAAMDDSQRVAAYVAERAAGLPIADARVEVTIAGFLPESRARTVLRVGDRIARVERRSIAHAIDVTRAVAALHGTDDARIEVERSGRILRLHVPTITTPNGRRVGIAVHEHTLLPTLPVPVHFSLDNIEGGSAGLMFSLDIYAALKGDSRSASPIAGTGTIASDGSVGPIEGTRQKLIAAERAGAALFLVPTENYGDVRGETGIRIVPVATFAQALAAARSAR